MLYLIQINSYDFIVSLNLIGFCPSLLFRCYRFFIWMFLHHILDIILLKIVLIGKI